VSRAGFEPATLGLKGIFRMSLLIAPFLLMVDITGKNNSGGSIFLMALSVDDAS